MKTKILTTNIILNAIGIRLLILAIFFFYMMPSVFSQDFYFDKKKSEAVYLNYRIPTEWVDLNLNEAYDFLASSGFTDIKITSNYNREIVSGRIPSQEYRYMRQLVFEDKVIKEYSDGIMFIQPCILCLANEMKLKLKNNPTMQPIIEESYQSALKEDKKLKDLFYRNQTESIKRDGIETQLLGDVSDFGFKFSNSIRTADYDIVRNCSLKLDDKNIYNFFSERKVIINEQNYLVGNYNLKEVNQYDLNLMIDVFLLDCKNHNINVKKGKVIASFETLDNVTLGLSYGINNDAKIELKIDPEKWNTASIPKRWYLIYHELGHDVLNLKHGNGGKMMFNFADKGYSWKEFWEDRAYMLESYKK